MHNTAWIREARAINVAPPEGFIANRLATFFLGQKSRQRAPSAKPYVTFYSSYLGYPRLIEVTQGRIAATPFLIAVSPVTLIMSTDQLRVLYRHERHHTSLSTKTR